ncbi:V3 protein [Duck circovirus]|uniref:V3 protein n=1 Tax=Duck circovirus TaxID=324685 RepID=D0V3X8_9CIRC|nr:V3 protein [Duck circovirus]
MFKPHILLPRAGGSVYCAPSSKLKLCHLPAAVGPVSDPKKPNTVFLVTLYVTTENRRRGLAIRSLRLLNLLRRPRLFLRPRYARR